MGRGERLQAPVERFEFSTVPGGFTFVGAPKLVGPRKSIPRIPENPIFVDAAGNALPGFA